MLVLPSKWIYSFYTQEFSSLSGSKLNHVRDIDLSRDDEEWVSYSKQ